MCTKVTLSHVTLHGDTKRLRIYQIFHKVVSVATYLMCGRIFNDDFITNLLLNPTVNKSRKSFSVWQSYGHRV